MPAVATSGGVRFFQRPEERRAGARDCSAQRHNLHLLRTRWQDFWADVIHLLLVFQLNDPGSNPHVGLKVRAHPLLLARFANGDDRHDPLNANNVLFTGCNADLIEIRERVIIHLLGFFARVLVAARRGRFHIIHLLNSPLHQLSDFRLS